MATREQQEWRWPGLATVLPVVKISEGPHTWPNSVESTSKLLHVHQGRSRARANQLGAASTTRCLQATHLTVMSRSSDKPSPMMLNTIAVPTMLTASLQQTDAQRRAVRSSLRWPQAGGGRARCTHRARTKILPIPSVTNVSTSKMRLTTLTVKLGKRRGAHRTVQGLPAGQSNLQMQRVVHMAELAY